MSRRKKKPKPSHGHDLHHLLFTRKNWDKGYKLLLRRAFVYELPLGVHQKLHATVRPVPPIEEDEAKRIWEDFKQVDYEMNIFEALEWLRLHSPNSAFAIAMIEQQGFLQNNL